MLTLLSCKHIHRYAAMHVTVTLLQQRAMSSSSLFNVFMKTSPVFVLCSNCNDKKYGTILLRTNEISSDDIKLGIVRYMPYNYSCSIHALSA